MVDNKAIIACLVVNHIQFIKIINKEIGHMEMNIVLFAIETGARGDKE